MIHHVFANRSNIGDWLSARAIQQLLQPLDVIEHLCDEPFVASTLAALRDADTQDLVVIGGGGLFMDYFNPFWDGLAAMENRPPICIWGVGYCDLKFEPTLPRLHTIGQVVSTSAICVVRDALTQRHLGMDGMSSPLPCPSMCAIDPQPPGWGLLHVDNYTTVGASAYDVMDRLCREYAEHSARPYRQTNNRIEAGHEGQLGELLRRYALSDLVVSSALHGCVIAVAMGRPVLAVSGDHKIEAFMQAAGLGEWVLDARAVNDLPASLRRLPHQRQEPDFRDQIRAGNAAIALQVQQFAAGLGRQGAQG